MFGQGNLAPQFRGNGPPPPPPPPPSSSPSQRPPPPPTQFQQGHPRLPPPPPPPFLQGHSQLPPPPPFQKGHSQSRTPPPPFQQGHSQFPHPPPPFQQGHSRLPPPPPPPHPYFQQGHSQLPPPPPFQQGHSQLPPPHHLQQNPSPAGPPPFRQPLSQGLPTPPPSAAQLHPIVQRPHVGSHPLQYHHGPQRPMPPPSGMMGTGQPYMRPSASNYGSAPMVNSYPSYPPPMGTHNFHNVTATATLSNREPPPPSSSSQGNVSNRHPLPSPSGIQHIPTPPPLAPSSIAPVIPESIVHGPPNVGHSSVARTPLASPLQPPPPPPPPLVPSSPPPPPPPPPSSPPPSPPPPSTPPPPSSPPPTSAVDHVYRFPRDHYVDNASAGDSLLHNCYQVEAGSIDAIFPKRGGQLVELPAPPIKLPGNVIQNIKDSRSEQSGSPPLPAAVDETAASAHVNSDMDMDDDIGFPYSEDLSAPNSPMIVVGDELGSSRLTTAGTNPSKVMSPIHADENPFRHIQGYASDDSSEDAERNYISDVSPVRVSPKHVTALKASPKEAIESYDNVGSNNTLETTQTQTYNVPISLSPHEDDKIEDLVCHQEDIRSPVDKNDTLDTSHKYEGSESSNDDTQQDGTFQREECKKEDSMALKVDEFGRMVREGVSDSDSEGNRYKMRYARRRRGSNRSLSPRRRKNKRSMSPSLSPRRSRVRDKSPPSYKHSSGFVKRERGETPQCFNFLRRRCHRGASCRYLHHEHGQHRSKTQENQDIPHVSDNYQNACHPYLEAHDSKYVVKETEVADYVSIPVEVGKIQEFPLDPVKSISDIQTSDHEISDSKIAVDSGGDGGDPTLTCVASHPHSSEKAVQDRDSKELNACEQQQDVLLTQEAPKQYSRQDDSQDPEARIVILAGVPLSQSSPVKHPDSQSVPAQHLQPECPSISNECMLSTGTFPHDPSDAKPSTEQTYLMHACPTPVGQPSANNVPDHSQPMHSSEIQSYTIPSSGHELHPSQLPQSTQFPQHILGSDYHYGVAPQNSTWTNIPQPFHFGGSSRPIVPNTDFNTAHITHGSMPLESKFQSMPDFRPPFVNHQVQAFRGSNFVRADQPSHPSVTAGTQFSFGHPSDHHSSHSHPIRMEPADPFQQQSFHNPRSFHYPQQPLGSPHQSASGTFPMTFSVPNTTSSHFTGTTSNIQYGLSGSDILKTSNVIHYNPFASTFEKPMTFGLENTNYGNRNESSFARQQHPVADHGPRLSATDFRTDGTFYAGSQSKIVSTLDKYDPLFDSIDATPRLTKKANHNIDKASVGPSGAVNDEFGETATDAEVGVVEDGSPLPGNDAEWSPGIPIDMIDPASGEVDLERVPSPGKSKKSKDSRFTKLFKVAVANFVKEVLKPSWRQGNLSKEAFKTIVKKTVDKVSSTMPSHHVPKTQAKIDQYVESSQRKLTKLVMGYVDKYVKM